MKLLFAILPLLGFNFQNPLLFDRTVFIDVNLGSTMDQDGVIELQMEWKFDLESSEILVPTFDHNHDSIFNSRELLFIRRHNLENMKIYNYYLGIVYEDALVSLTEPISFTAWIREGFLYFDFTFEIDLEFNNLDGTKIFLYDPTENHEFEIQLTHNPVLDYIEPPMAVEEKTMRIQTFNFQTPDIKVFIYKAID